MSSPSTLLRTMAIGIAATAALALASCSEHQAAGAGTDSPQPTSATDPPAPRKPSSDYPLATPHPTNPKLVISPYKPHNVIDIGALRSRQLAFDPSTAPLDPATGKPDMNRAKIFEIP